jgi:radical SAM protein with 4Fe4S-binding SPASM domain
MDLTYLSQSKIFAHLDRVEDWIRKGNTKPVMIEIDPTNNCNYNCPECAGNKFSNSSLSLDFMKNVIDQVFLFVKGAVFTGGGEPLCNKDTIEVVKYAKIKGMDVGFITNGSLITKEVAKELVENCVWIRVSIDADNSEDYNLIHGTEDLYEKVLENVGFLVNAKKDNFCTVGVGFLTNKDNFSKMVSFTNKMKNLNVDYVQFRPFHFDNFDVSNEIKDCKKLEDSNFKIIVSQHKYDKVEYNFPEAFRDQFTTVISADGKMYPCCFTRGMKDFELGDLNKESFDDIWNSERKRVVFKNKLKMENCPVICKYDKLSQILWEIKKVNEKGKHLSFV